LEKRHVEYEQGNPEAALDPLNKGLSLAVQFDNPEQKRLILQALEFLPLDEQAEEAIKSIRIQWRLPATGDETPASRIASPNLLRS